MIDALTQTGRRKSVRGDRQHCCSRGTMSLEPPSATLQGKSDVAMGFPVESPNNNLVDGPSQCRRARIDGSSTSSNRSGSSTSDCVTHPPPRSTVTRTSTTPAGSPIAGWPNSQEPASRPRTQAGQCRSYSFGRTRTHQSRRGVPNVTSIAQVTTRSSATLKDGRPI